MIELMSFLKSLISVSGLSGHETPARLVIEEAWRPLCDTLQTSRLGSLHALKRGCLPEPRPGLLLAAHMDAIGMMVTALEGEFLRFTEVGGLDPRVLPGQLVTVHGRQDLPGVIVQPPAHLLPPDLGSGATPLEYLLVDTGLSTDDLQSQVRPGDLISFAQPPLELNADILVGHSLDNRASVAALTYCLAELKNRQTAWDIWAVASTQEEVTYGGAFTSAFQLRPTLAVAVDVSHASGPGSPNHKTFPLGKGITLGFGPNVHPALYKALKDLADRMEISYKIEVMPRHSGTDAYALQVAADGTPTMVIGIPLRYMHTPVEMASLKDISRAGRLLAEFAACLDDKFMQTITYEIDNRK
jgi:endoglucanase